MKIALRGTLAAVVLVAAISGLPACNSATTVVPVSESTAAGTIKGVVTAEDINVISTGGGNVISTGGGNVISTGGGNFSVLSYKGAVVKATSSIDSKEVPVSTDGSFTVTVKGGADYTLEATVPDGKGGTFKVVSPKVTVPLAQDPPIVDVKSLVTRRTGSIQGLVKLKDAKAGETVEGADVFLSGGTSVVGKAGETGRFALTGVAEGTWNVVIQKPGFKQAVVKGVEVKAGRPKLLEATVALERDQEARAGLKGMVQDSSGNAIAGATISAFPKDRALIVDSDAGLDNFTAVSDDAGRFEMLNLPAGSYQVQVYRPFYQLPARQNVTVMPNNTLDLGPTKLVSTVVYFGKISGVVKDDKGQPIPGVAVQLAPQVTDQQLTDANGRFTLDRVMPGEYTMSVSAGSYQIFARELHVQNEQNFELNLDEITLVK